MNPFLTFAYLFSAGSLIGWISEVLFRNRHAKGKKRINPGFCKGPCLPIYGFGLCLLFLLAELERFLFFENEIINKILLFFLMAVCLTAMEYAGGIFCIKILKVRLWDYSDNKGNINGIICPLFSFFWAVSGALYYFFIHPGMEKSVGWLSENPIFSLFAAIYFTICATDIANSFRIAFNTKDFSKERSAAVLYEKKHEKEKTDE